MRTRSAPTEIRHLKRQLSVLQELNADQARTIERLQFTGIQLANICFNLKQRADLPEDVRSTCARVQTEWDKLRSARIT
jgi:hypothetical protein